MNIYLHLCRTCNISKVHYSDRCREVSDLTFFPHFIIFLFWCPESLLIVFVIPYFGGTKFTCCIQTSLKVTSSFAVAHSVTVLSVHECEFAACECTSLCICLKVLTYCLLVTLCQALFITLYVY